MVGLQVGTSDYVMAQADTKGVAAIDEASFFTVAEYNPDRSPSADLKATVKRAQAEGKRILLDVGGEWCSWCHAFDRYIVEHEAVATALRKDFLIMKVNYSEANFNRDFLSAYPKIPGYPHLFVLEKDGTLLLSKSTGDLEEGSSYNQDVFLAFLAAWAPAHE